MCRRGDLTEEIDVPRVEEMERNGTKSNDVERTTFVAFICDCQLGPDHVVLCHSTIVTTVR